MNEMTTPYRDVFFNFRGTGRTYRMLKEAIEAVHLGHRVVVVTGSSREYHQLVQMAMRIDETLTPGEWWRLRSPATGGSLEFLPQSSDDWSWGRRRIRGLPPETLIFIDHHAVEVRYGGVLAEWLRYT